MDRVLAESIKNVTVADKKSPDEVLFVDQDAVVEPKLIELAKNLVDAVRGGDL